MDYVGADTRENMENGGLFCSKLPRGDFQLRSILVVMSGNALHNQTELVDAH